MIRVPRLALATCASGPEPAPAVLALLAALNGRRLRVQHFCSRARPTSDGLVARASGLPDRHLDSWLMSPEILREIFLRGAASADLAVIEGTLDNDPPPVDLRRADRPGRLGPIAETLDLPRLAILRIAADEPFHLPALPSDIDAILLDETDGPEHFASIRRVVETLTRCPVIGGVERLPLARNALKSSDPWQAAQAMAALATSFLELSDIAAIRYLAESRELDACCNVVRVAHRSPAFRVAYAQDAAFGGYFPDTLETLEALGAELQEFSPLRDEELPQGADLVLIGHGCPELYADDLAANLSMISALRTHVCRGRRIYTEGGGTAYLGRALIFEGRIVPMAGIFPFDAELRPLGPSPSPVTRTFLRAGWLGPRGTVVRGYRSNKWRLHAAPEVDDCPIRSGVLTAQRDVYFRHNAVGSLVHLHLASLPEVVAAFATPSCTSMAFPSSSTIISGHVR
jgi:cobyrinic acid a,c-diamide synthase